MSRNCLTNGNCCRAGCRRARHPGCPVVGRGSTIQPGAGASGEPRALASVERLRAPAQMERWMLATGDGVAAGDPFDRNRNRPRVFPRWAEPLRCHPGISRQRNIRDPEPHRPPWVPALRFAPAGMTVFGGSIQVGTAPAPPLTPGRLIPAGWRHVRVRVLLPGRDGWIQRLTWLQPAPGR